ncbi:MAG TPA: hypothetical protein PLD10_21570, partial [Rhodopila sp.]|nr:hypothetical protein [Rhodopila sp.]
MITVAGGTAPLAVLVNGVPMAGLLQAAICSTNCYEADCFSLTFALGPPPLTDAGFWASISVAEVEIVATVAPAPITQTLLIGLIDTIRVNPIQATITIEGRDLSARLIDAYRQQDFANQTAAEIVSAVAQQHGLMPMVSTTGGMTGRYYGDGYTRLSLGQFSRLRSDWDVVVQLARENMCDVFVSGRSLYFQPVSLSGFIPIPLSITSVTTMHIERSLSLGVTPALRVQSWNSQDMAAYVNGGLAPAGSMPGGDTAPAFLFTAANLTSAQVDGAASRINAELMRLGSILECDMPLDLTFSPRGIVFLT